MSPRVSLSLPVYNGEKFIEQGIQSILDQDFEDFELVITDNASIDRTEEICIRFADRDPRIRYFRNDRNLGAAGNFNRGFELTSGEYFKWCAHDDFISPDYLRECVNVLDGSTGAAIAYGNLVGIDQDGNLNGYVEKDLPDINGSSAALRFRSLLDGGLVAAVFGLYRRDALAKTPLHKPYFTSDLALLAEMALLGRIIHAPGAILYNREHPTRSTMLRNTERVAWQEPNASSQNPLEFSNRILQLTEVVFRRRREAPLRQTLAFLLLWALSPISLGRLTLELVGAVSPSLRRSLTDVGWKILPASVGPRRHLLGSVDLRDRPSQRTRH